MIQRYCEGFPKKYSENFTYEREIQNSKKQTKSHENNLALTSNNYNIKSCKNSPNKPDRTQLSKDDCNEQNERDENFDSEFHESPLIKDDASSKKKHFTNSKLSCSVPAQNAKNKSSKLMNSKEDSVAPQFNNDMTN